MKNLFLRFSVLIACLMGTLLAKARYDFEVNGIYYRITSSSSKTVGVTNLTKSSGEPLSNSYAGNVAIPSTVDYNGTTYSVTSIYEYAFYDCPRLTAVNIPNSVTSIYEHAFYYCSGLTAVNIPNSVTSIYEHAFYYCI